MREINEEFHINLDIRSSSPFFSFTYTYNDTSVIEYEYIAYIKNPDQKIVINENDHSEYRWISKDEVAHYFAEDDDEKIAVEKGFELSNL